MTAILPDPALEGLRPAPALPVPRRTGVPLARPTSPVGRTSLATQATPAGPLDRLAARLGRPLLDLGQCSDAELTALTGLLLAETHARSARWLQAGA